ncbi:MAG: winged helix-turn-helix domain-containing protein, partial [Actinomycetota bacterium]
LALLAAFVRHPGQVLSRQQLLQMIWDLDFDPGSNVVEVYVAALRRKVGTGLIETVRGLGYRFVVPGEEALASNGTDGTPGRPEHGFPRQTRPQ